MSDSTDVSKLMEKLHTAHGELKQALKEWGAVGFAKQEPKPVIEKRKKFWSAYRRLFDDYLNPLDARFRSDEEQAINEVIDFLATDIPAIRCGYVKEKWLRRLKSTSLTSQQKERLMRAALALVISPGYRREIPEWNRLMIRLADKETVTALLNLAESDNQFIKSKALRMVHGILQNRNDVTHPGYLRRFFLFRVEEQIREARLKRPAI